MNTEEYRVAVGDIIAKKRAAKNLTQADLAEHIGTSQSAVNRIEKGRQNISLNMVAKISEVLETQILTINRGGGQNYVVNGGCELSGEVTINASKNAGVGLLCASLINDNKTTLKHLSHIEEIYRIIEVFNSLGVKTRWVNGRRDLEIIPPDELRIEQLDVEAARRTRSVIMLMSVLLHKFPKFRLPYAGGCSLGARTVEPHMLALSSFGLEVDAVCNSGFYEATVNAEKKGKDRKIVLVERGDTVTENALIAAALDTGTTTIVGASPNYMVQDVCFYLQKLGVKIEGVGTTTLKITGKGKINQVIEYAPAEDPIEAMSFLAAGIATGSKITIRRAPIEFLEIELEILRNMGAELTISPEYLSYNERSRLVDITTHKSELVAPMDKIHPMPFPGLNIDNLPFFAVIAASARGRTLIHDWVFENRAVYMTELAKLGADVQLLDAHRVYISGPTRWHSTELVAPPALRPSVVVLIAMLAAKGTSVLRGTYQIARGYEDFAARLRGLGADITSEA